MKRTLLFLCLFALCGISPAAKRAVVLDGNQLSEASCDRFIRSLPGLTMWLRADSGVTSSNNAVSAWASKVGSISFAQGTGANQPIISRGDNRENRYLGSTDIGAGLTASSNLAAFTAQADPAGGTTATRFTASGATSLGHNGYKTQAALIVGQGYRFVVWAKRIAGTANVTAPYIYQSGVGAGGAKVNLETCAINTCINGGGFTSIACDGSAEADGWCKITVQVVPSGAFTAPRVYVYVLDAALADTFTAAGESIDLYAPIVQSTLADPVYLATTTAPEYRSPFQGGRKAVWFDGSNDAMTSASLLSDVFGAGAKSFAFVLSPSTVANSSHMVLRDAGSKFIVDVGSATLGKTAVTNNDGSADVSETAITANAATIVSGYHDGTNLVTYANGGNGASTASGNTAALTGAIQIGQTSTPYAGPLGEAILGNVVWSSSDRARLNRCLARRYGADLN